MDFFKEFSFFKHVKHVKKNKTRNPLNDLSDLWWDEEGPFEILHTLLPLRMEWFVKVLESRSLSIAKSRILDVGCGGGLFCEPLARLGAQVTGIDVSEKAICVAQQHQKDLGINYLCADFQDSQFQKDWLCSDPERFDVICLFEVLEHVASPLSFLELCMRRMKPGGMIIGSTLNRTISAWLLGIQFAEFIAGWVPQHTHHISGLIQPAEMRKMMQVSGMQPFFFEGLCFNPLKKNWVFTPHMPINYFFSGIYL